MTPAKRIAANKSNRFQWRHGTLVIDKTIVGSISKGASGHWFAYGCMDEWEDTPLGCFEERQNAMDRVHEWAETHL